VFLLHIGWLLGKGNIFNGLIIPPKPIFLRRCSTKPYWHANFTVTGPETNMKIIGEIPQTGFYFCPLAAENFTTALLMGLTVFK